MKVNSHGHGRPLSLVYIDPITGKKIAKSSGTNDERKAIGMAAVWEDELRSGRYQAAGKVTWEHFVERYPEEKLSSLAPSTRETALASLNHLKRVMPAVLQRLMRHSAIQTTMSYYVDLAAGEVADDLWAQFGGEGGWDPHRFWQQSGRNRGSPCPQ